MLLIKVEWRIAGSNEQGFTDALSVEIEEEPGRKKRNLEPMELNSSGGSIRNNLGAYTIVSKQ